jgi:hypothetical protein
MSASDTGAGPATHYDLFAGLRGAGVSYLLTGAAALVLHGVPRLTPDVDLAVDPDPANVARLERLLAAWGYGEGDRPTPCPEGASIRRFRHPFSALEAIDVVLPTAAGFARLRAGAAVATLVDIDIPFVGADDLRTLKEQSATDAGRDDASGLELLASLRSGGNVDRDTDETRREQIRKFSRWSVAARLDWLLAAARLGRGMSPEARPMTRGLVRRRPWTERRG